MFGIVARLLGGIFTPVVDQIQASTSRLLRKVALLVVAAVAAVVVVLALTIAFAMWIASLSNPIGGVLAVAGVYLVVALVAAVLALRGGSPPKASGAKKTTGAQKSARATSGEKATAQDLNDQVDAFAAPLLNMLQRLGLRREQLAVLTGMSVAKQLGPVPLVCLAIVAGFLVGRMWKSWRGLISSDVVASILSADLLAGLFRPRPEGENDEA